MTNSVVRSGRRGFTLVELLVVVSIIALLISILLPTIGEVRRQARISLCTANMKQHGQGVSNFAAANKDELPHVPKNNYRTPENRISGPVPYRFAIESLPASGVTFGDGGGPLTSTSPAAVENVLNGSEFINSLTAQAWNCYWMYLAEYMLDRTGSDVFDPIFLSPSDTAARSAWPRLRQNVSNRAQTAGSTATNPNGWFTLKGFRTPSQMSPNVYTAPLIDGIPCINGSYRYVIAALTDWRLYAFKYDGTPLVEGPGIPPWEFRYNTPFGPGAGSENFIKFVRRNVQATMDYPSQKVLFYMWNAWHNPNRDAWFEQDAVCPVALGDGSARATIPYREAIPLSYTNSKENAGPMFKVYFTAAASSSYDCQYMMTNGGLKGRDL